MPSSCSKPDPKPDPKPDIDARISQANHRMKVAQLGVQIERRGQKLSLRATLPPRPGSHRLRPHQQRVSLDLPVTTAGLKKAEDQAKIIAAQLIEDRFDWRQHLPVGGGGRLHEMDLSQKLQAFERHRLEHMSQTRPLSSVKTTWQKAYAPYIGKLATIARSSTHLALPELIYATVYATPAHSRSRQVCCTALKALAEFLQIDLPIDLKTLWGTYNASQTQARDLPSDQQILTAYNQIPNPAWRFVYGIMATYGLRNHEVFFCDYTALSSHDPEGMIEVLNTTKTGSHEVWAFPPEWIDRFSLRAIQLPPVNTDLNQTTLQRIGQQVTRQFRRYQIPFSPYDLRHAWAVRTIHVGLPDTVSARMMGHSVAVHTRTYHRWLTRRDQQQAVKAVLNKPLT